MTSVWAVTRTTFIQSLRSKVGLVAMVLLAVLLLAAPMMVNNGASPLADRIRTFLSYSVGLTGVILAVITIFLSTTFFCSDVQKKQIFLLAAKPLSRWQYVLGRWLGVVLLDALLLAVAGMGIYAGAQYLRSQPALTPTDRRAVETEVFTARRKITPDFSRDNELVADLVNERVAHLRHNDEFENMVQSYLPAAGGNREKAMEMIGEEFERQARERLQSVPPGWFGRPYIFRNVHVTGMTRIAAATVNNINKDYFLLLLEIPEWLAAELVPGRPVDVNGALSRVLDVGDNRLMVQVSKDPFFAQGLGGLKLGESVEITLEPMMELSYKISPGTTVPSGGTVRSSWVIGPENPERSRRIYDPIDQEDVPHRTVSVITSGRCVDDDGAVVARYFNANATVEGGRTITSISIAPDDISLLYAVGSFGPNVASAMVTILVQLMFIAALGVLTATFLSFPVAVLFSGSLVLVTQMMGYLVDSMKFMPGDSGDALFRGVIGLLSFLLPNLSALSPTEAIASGVEVATFTEGWRLMAMNPNFATFWQALTSLQTPLVTLIVLAIGCVIFTKRELARVQV